MVKREAVEVEVPVVVEEARITEVVEAAEAPMLTPINRLAPMALAP